jgi:hypothetical protein
MEIFHSLDACRLAWTRGVRGLIYSNLSRQSEELDVGMHFRHQSRTSEGETSGSVTGRSQTDLWFVLAEFANVHDPFFGIFVSYKSLFEVGAPDRYDK